MTYNVFSGTLNPTQSQSFFWSYMFRFWHFPRIHVSQLSILKICLIVKWQEQQQRQRQQQKYYTPIQIATALWFDSDISAIFVACQYVPTL